MRGDAAQPAGQRGHGGLLEVGVDRGADRRRLARLGAGEHAVAGDQQASGTAGQPILERALEPVPPDRPVAREPARVEAVAVCLASARARGCPRSRPRARRAGSCARRRPLGQHLAVAGQERRSHRGAALPRKALARGHAGEGEARASRPRDRRCTGTRRRARTRPNTRVCIDTGTTTEPSRSPSGSPAATRIVVAVAAERSYARLNAAQRIGAARARVEHRVHGAQVAALPGLGEVAGGALGRRRGARADHHARGEGDHRDHAHRGERTEYQAPAALGSKLSHGRAASILTPAEPCGAALR